MKKTGKVHLPPKPRYWWENLTKREEKKYAYTLSVFRRFYPKMFEPQQLTLL